MSRDTESEESSRMLSETSNMSDQEHANMLAEYQALREDILQRIQFRYQLINLLLVVAGTFLSIGSGVGQLNVAAAPILLIYPILALFLAASWAHNGLVIVIIGQYIKDEIEPKMIGLNWQTNTWKSFPKFSSFSMLGLISTSGLILTTQVLAIFLALLKFTSTSVEIALLIFSSIAIIITAFLLYKAKDLRR